ncbi:acyltransferase family protein [Microvirga flavescens]|uniref:acyltransferase family protein n=1 Tax=Microvirga flavescens TaxID=2249811 RepID=UPI000DD56D23|nr:acyltransferase [Microvirga flavescens]
MIGISAPQKNESLEAIRGLASLNVALSHYLISFFPFVGNFLWNGHDFTTRPVTQRYDWEGFFGAFPFTLLFNGTFPVCIFFALSGYVLSASFIYTGRYEALRSAALKRYPRIVIPVLVSVLVTWALIASGAMSTWMARSIGAAPWLTDIYSKPVPLLSAIWTGAIGAPLLGEVSINVPLWTIKIEIIASFMLFAAYALAGNRRPYLAAAFFIAGVVALFPSSDMAIYYMTFFAGSLVHYSKRYLGRLEIAGGILIAFGIFLGAFDYSPRLEWFAGIVPSIGWLNATKMQVSYSIGALCLLAGVVTSARASAWLERPILVYTGKISFGLYLLHWPIICSLGFAVVGALLNLGVSYPIAVGGSAIVTFAAIFTAAAAFTRFVDSPATELGKRLARRQGATAIDEALGQAVR